MLTTKQLPDDIAALKALVIGMSASMQKLEATVASRSHEIERLNLLIDKLKRMMFGRRSEKLIKQVEQLQLELEELQIAEAAEQPVTESAAKETAPRKRPTRKPLPDHLP